MVNQNQIQEAVEAIVCTIHPISIVLFGSVAREELDIADYLFRGKYYNNLKTAVRLFLEEAEKMGTLEDILSESGYEKAGVGDWLTPRLIATELMSVHN